jgi:hypothetical protein
MSQVGKVSPEYEQFLSTRLGYHFDCNGASSSRVLYSAAELENLHGGRLKPGEDRYADPSPVTPHGPRVSG